MNTQAALWCACSAAFLLFSLCTPSVYSAAPLLPVAGGGTAAAIACLAGLLQVWREARSGRLSYQR